MGVKFDYIGTFTGKHLHFLNPNPEEVCIEDIANALGNCCRYSGHVKRFYSVAEHSIIMANYVYNETRNAEFALTALMHDATEAYLVDVPRPIKPHLEGYMDIEESLSNVIFEKFNIQPMGEYIHYLDTNIVRNEAEILFKDIPDWVQYYEKIPNVELLNLSPSEAGKLFMETFEYYINLRESLYATEEHY